MESKRGSLVGWNVREFVKGNVSDIRAIIKTGIAAVAAVSYFSNPITQIIVVGLGKTALDVFDYWVSEYQTIKK